MSGVDIKTRAVAIYALGIKSLHENLLEHLHAKFAREDFATYTRTGTFSPKTIRRRYNFAKATKKQQHLLSEILHDFLLFRDLCVHRPHRQ